jgi:4-hydroxybenzoate polyprenyltransferase
VILISAVPLLSGLIYSTPIFPKGFRYRRLKEIPVAKSLLVAFAWALPPALLPVYIAGASPDLVTLAVILFFFSLVFINTVLFDIRDVEGDRATGVRTIPVCIGVTNTKILLTLVNILFGGAVVALLYSRIPLIYLGMLIIGMIYAQAYIMLYQKVSTGNLQCDLIADGQFIVLALLMGGVISATTALQLLPL